MHPRQWIEIKPEGIYCKPGGFYIDPTRPVDHAIDHPRPWRPCARRPRYGTGNAGDLGNYARPLRGRARESEAAIRSV